MTDATEALPMLDELEARARKHPRGLVEVSLAAWRDFVRPAIEREAAQQERERIRAAVDHAPIIWERAEDQSLERTGYSRAAIRAILAEPSDE